MSKQTATQDALNFFHQDELRAKVFIDKYALREEDNTVVEKTPMEMWRRVASEMASVEKSKELQQSWSDNFYWLLEDFRFIPGGRILFGAGRKQKSTLLNCYYIPIKGDTIEDIFNFAKDMARTYSYGGGVGTRIDVLRPKGAPVNNAALKSTGSVSFMELFSTVTGTIGQSGRRGALMIATRVDHPDILDFIHVKRDLSKVNYANISVMLTDTFMKAVEEDTEYDLTFKNEKVEYNKRLKAREVWNQLVESAWSSAEPGLLMWDNIKKYSTTEYNNMEVQGVNPCAEETLEDYGCCCLGNLNLAAFVLDRFTPNARVDWENLERSLAFATRFLDNVLDYNAEKHPLPQQKDASMRSRRIGVGFTGLADMLIMLNKKYDDEATILFVDQLFERIKNRVYLASSDLAAEKGVFPAFDPKKHLKQPFVQALQPETLEAIKVNGLRNAASLTVPPVGSGSILAGTSSGVEPVFALSYLRRTKSLAGGEGEHRVYHPLVMEYMSRFELIEEKDLPQSFVTAHQIRPDMRVMMQAAIQKHIDTSISSTINLPEESTVEEVGRIYMLAWKMGCKGVTVYREGSREAILVSKEQEEKKAKAGSTGSPQAPAGNVTSFGFDRPQVLTGTTLGFKLQQGKIYITANRDENNNVREVFLNLGKSGGEDKANSEAIGRLISLYLQKGGAVDDIVKAIKGIQGEYVSWDQGTQLLSIPDAAAKALEIMANLEVKTETFARKCPECHEKALYNENGCYVCKQCGYTKCS